jgi:hypothetical protein
VRLEEGTPFEKRCPALWEYLTVTAWPDGTPRVPSSLTLFLADGLFKACLSDKEAERVCFVSGASLEALLASLEASLAQHKADWRPSREAAAKRRK